MTKHLARDLSNAESLLVGGGHPVPQATATACPTATKEIVYRSITKTDVVATVSVAVVFTVISKAVNAALDRACGS